jgi:predicted amidophosphoribosyltransferase
LENVLLVDDVFATGAMANEVAKTLKMAGVGKIYIFTLGRVIVVKELDS